MDVILQLIEKAGDFVSDDIWYRVVQFVTNNEDLQVSIVQTTELVPFAIRLTIATGIRLFTSVSETRTTNTGNMFQGPVQKTFYCSAYFFLC